MSGSCLKIVLSESAKLTLLFISIWFNPGILISTGSSTVVILTSGLLSNESPAGKALMGAKVGDIVTYKSNIGDIQMKVLEIKA